MTEHTFGRFTIRVGVNPQSRTLVIKHPRLGSLVLTRWKP